MYSSKAPQTLLNQIGSFWTDRFNIESSKAIGLSAAFIYEQNQLDQRTVFNALSRNDIDLYRTDLWRHVSIAVADLEADSAALYKYEESSEGVEEYDGDITFGQVSPQNTHKVTIDPNIKDVGFITDSPYSPSVVLVNGVDFKLESGQLHFLNNPEFVFPIETDEDSKQFIDFYLFNSSYDISLLFEQYGYAIGANLGSNEEYKTYINSTWDDRLLGSNSSGFKRAAGALLQIPVARGVEVVAVIQARADRLEIITDQHVYSLPGSTTAAVSVGDTVNPGDSLINEFKFYYLDTMDSLTEDIVLTRYDFPPAWKIRKNITFKNEDVSVTYSTVGGQTQAEWPLTGDTATVERYWEKVHARGATTGNTVANGLIYIYNQYPTQINPAKFIAQHLWGDNLVLIINKPSKTGFVYTDSDITLLRRLLPAHVGLRYQEEA